MHTSIDPYIQPSISHSSTQSILRSGVSAICASTYPSNHSFTHPSIHRTDIYQLTVYLFIYTSNPVLPIHPPIHSKRIFQTNERPSRCHSVVHLNAVRCERVSLRVSVCFCDCLCVCPCA